MADLKRSQPIEHDGQEIATLTVRRPVGASTPAARKAFTRAPARSWLARQPSPRR